jgi:hypothetical protein
MRSDKFNTKDANILEKLGNSINGIFQTLVIAYEI